MKSRVRVAAVAAAVTALAAGGIALADIAAVGLTATGPQPPTVTVNLGDTIHFANSGTAAYTVSASRLGLTSPSIPPGGTFDYVAVRSGSFPYQQQTGARTGFPGTIVVLRAAASLALNSSHEAIVYGKGTTLSGVTSLPQFPVTIEYKPANERAWLTLGTLTPAPDGTFALAVKPTIASTYRAKALGNELISEPVQVAVKPPLTIRSSASKVPGGKVVTLVVRVTPRTAVRSVDIRRYDAKNVVWQRLVTLPVSLTGTTGIATYKWTVPYGRTLLRAWVVKKNLKPGYAESYSSQILVQGTGKPPAPPAADKDETKKKKGKNRRQRRRDR